MSNALMVFGIAMAIVILGTVPAFFLWRKWFAPDLFHDDRVSAWKGLRRRSQGEMRLEEAKKRASEGSFGMALQIYRAHLAVEPDDPQARLGAADCLLELSIRGTRKDPEKKAEALVHYRWLLERYQKSGGSEKALALYRRLDGPYSREELSL